MRERSAQCVSRVRWPVQFRHTRTDEPTHTYSRSTNAHKHKTPSATPHAVPQQRRSVAFGSMVSPTSFHGSTIVHVLVCACITMYTGSNPVCVWVEWNGGGVPGRRDPGPKSWCASHFCVGVLPLRINADVVCVVRVALSIPVLLYVRRSRDRHRMGVPPLSDPLTAVGVEAPALTANISHIPGFKPVLRRFPICPVRPMDCTKISVTDNQKSRLLRDTYLLSQNRQKLSCEAGGLSRY